MSANGTPIPKQGQQSLNIVANKGNQGRTCFQVGEVERPLMSVTTVTDQGHDVLFQSDGGYVYNQATGKCIRFERRNNVYHIDLWMTSEDANGTGSQSGFARPGL